LLAGAVGGCHGASDTTSSTSPSEHRPDVLLVTIDTLRADHTSAYGYPIPTTPVLEQLAGEGMRFPNMYAASATTGPSHAALLTGRYPRALGYLKNGHVLHGEFRTLAEILTDAGYQTAAFVSSMPVGSAFGFGQGFEHYDQQPSTRSPVKRNGARRNSRYGDETVDALDQWLRRRRDPRPLFVWLHLFDPHAPYQSPEQLLEGAKWPRRTSSPNKRYDAEIRFADQQLGRAVTMLRKRAGDRGVIVATTADHGEGLGDHNWRGHGLNLHQEAVRVPLVVSWPGRLEPAEPNAPAMLIDVAPTILSLLDMTIPEEFDGRDLTGALPEDRTLFLQRREYGSRREKGRRVKGEMIALVTNRFKYIRAPQEKRWELYDLHEDPGEMTNLAKEKKIVRAKLEKQVRQWLEDTPPPNFKQPEISDEDRDALRALGYVD